MALYAFDGTWNKRQNNPDDPENTNVVRFARCYSGDPIPNHDEPYCYQDGVGSRWGAPGKLLGGVSGAGGKKRIRGMLKMLKKQWKAGDKVIDVVGFSRGAALALDFVNKLEDPKIKRELGNDVTVRFVGLFDIVGSFGLPIGKFFQPLNVGHDLHLPGIVKNAYHAISLDEIRQTFRPTLPYGAYDVLFRGVHSDIGGGGAVESNKKMAKRGLASIPLYWMLHKAKLCGLPIDEQAINLVRNERDSEEPILINTDFAKNPFRTFSGSETYHHSVAVRGGEHNDPVATARFETKDDEAKLKSRVQADVEERDGMLLITQTPIRVPADDIWVATGVEIEAGATYHFKVDKSPDVWCDSGYHFDPDGNPMPEGQKPHSCRNRKRQPKQKFKKMNKFRWLRRNRKHGWLALMGTVGKNDQAAQKIGTESSLSFSKSGSLYVYANDARFHSTYNNNSGVIYLTIWKT